MSQSATSPLKEFRKAKGGINQTALGLLFTPPRHKTTVLRWERDGIPMKNVIEVEKVTGIPRSELCPDMFGISENAEHSK